jgi:uncharacterized membrane protein YfcA
VVFELGTSVLLFFAATAIGFMASILGLGGGVFMVPLLFLGGFVGTQPEAAGTSIAGVLFTGISASIAYFRREAIDFRVGLLFTPSALAGVLLGRHIVATVHAAWLTLAFGVFLLYPAATMLLGRTSKDIASKARERIRGWQHVALVVVLGFVAGMATKLFGIGGGTVFVPSLVLLLGMDIVSAAAVSLFVMIPTAALSTATSWIDGTLRLEFAIPLVLGIVIGAQIGPHVGARIPKKRLRQLFGAILVYAAVSMILKGLP